jgi:hypothetical protein
MKLSTKIFYLVTGLSIWSCESTQTPSQKPLTEASSQKIDTANVVKIDGKWAVPKKSFDFNTLGNSAEDTLKIVTCGDYVFSPFGDLTDKSQLKASLLNNFNVKNRVDTMDIGPYEFQILNLKNSRLILFFNEEGSTHSYIIKGEVNDSEVNFEDGVKIGMSKEKFINTFFEEFPKELLSKYNYFVFESCVTNIWHTYAFKNNKLESVKFKTDSYWKINY